MAEQANGNKTVSYYQAILKDLGLPDKPSSLKKM